MERVDAIGSPNVIFEYQDIYNCYQMLNDLVNGNYDCKDFAMNLPQKLESIEDDYIHEILDGITKLCGSFFAENKPYEIFIKEMRLYHSKLKEFCNY
ncbi:MAG: hypothetical protein K0S24_4962 [Sphingobacterium sp.]|jgi:hypothetical protein|nr:hypothetical protein [Sphingobacterium sp.]